MTAMKVFWIATGVAIVVAACHSMGAPKDRTLAGASMGPTDLTYACQFRAWSPGTTNGGIFMPDNYCGWTFQLAWSSKALPFPQVASPSNQCSENESLCKSGQATIATKDDGDSFRYAYGFESAKSGTVGTGYVAKNGTTKTLFRYRNFNGTPSSVLAKMPTADGAITDLIATSLATPPMEVSLDGMWEFLEDRARLHRHVAELLPSLQSCIPRESIVNAMLADSPDQVSGPIYEAASRDARCPQLFAALASGGVKNAAENLKRDLAEKDLKDGKQLVALTHVATALQAIDQVPALVSHATLPDEPAGSQEARYVEWLDLASALKDLDRERAASLLVIGISKSKGPAYKDQSPFNYSLQHDAYAPSFAIQCAAQLLDLDFPLVRKGLYEIGMDAKKSDAGRQMALVLLKYFEDPKAADIAKTVQLTPAQAQSIDVAIRNKQFAPKEK
jgi:hypothetical protein